MTAIRADNVKMIKKPEGYVVRTITRENNASYRVGYSVRATRSAPLNVPTLIKQVKSFNEGAKFVEDNGGTPVYLSEFHERDNFGFMAYHQPREITRRAAG